MKGVVFTEFLDMVADRFSADMVDDIIDDAQLPSGGAYTAVGTYPHSEMVALASALSRRSSLSLRDLLLAFGEHLFGRFVVAYPAFFTGQHDALSFLAGIEDIIHAEVRKLYPEAELPRFVVESRSTDSLTLIYASGRHFEDLAEGLMRGCFRHFGEAIDLQRACLGEGDARTERFVLRRLPTA
ncbi:MAG: heme NO-binding domain-containing protein [Azonexus sp.]|nr:heme NO-binding domain-containing protein [Azonexus sp.]